MITKTEIRITPSEMSREMLQEWGEKGWSRVAELEAALGTLYALVKGESPQLLEDDHHDGVVRSALHLD